MTIPTPQRLSGVVEDVQVWSETTIRGTASGGGGVIFNGTGSIAAPSLTINSTSRTRNRVAIRLAAGRLLSLELPGEFGVHSGNRLNLVQFDGETIVSVRNQDTGQASTTAELRRYIQGHSRPWLSSLLLLTGIVLMLIAVMGLSTYLRELGRPAELRENLATLPRILTFGLPGTILFIVGLVMNWSAGAGNRRITERNDAVLALASDFGS